ERIADFKVSKGINSRARIEESDSVCLWSRADVMLEYTSEEVTITRVYTWMFTSAGLSKLPQLL
ncbi:hypothetical protein MKW98_016350, partial [Papaver atlanticum]